MKAVTNKFSLFISLLFLLFSSNLNILLASTPELDKPLTTESDKKGSLSESYPFKLKMIPREIDAVVINKKFFSPSPDHAWHDKMFNLVSNSHDLIEKLCSTDGRPNSYNVATFKIRAFWEDPKVENSSVVMEYYNNKLLFLSKMDLSSLSIAIYKKYGIDTKNTADIIKFLKNINSTEMKSIDKEKRGIRTLDSSITNLVCLGDFFPTSEGERLTSQVKAKKFIGELFDFKESESDSKGSHEAPRDELSRRFMNSLTEEIGSFVYNGHIPKQWNAFKKVLGDFYSNSLYGILPFDEESNKKATKYFSGVNANKAFLKFEKNFADSEQGIFQFIMRQEMNSLKHKDNKAVLKYVVVDILSYRPICRFCEGTALRMLETDKTGYSIKRALKERLGISYDFPVNFFTSHIKDKFDDDE